MFDDDFLSFVVQGPHYGARWVFGCHLMMDGWILPSDLLPGLGCDGM
jgi:hypothetical protein